MNTKDEFLIEFRATRNTFEEFGKRYTALRDEIVKLYAPSKRAWVLSDADIFELLLSPEVETVKEEKP